MGKPAELYANTLRGMGKVTVREIKYLFHDAVQVARADQTRNLDIIPFTYEGPTADLWHIGTTEDIFASIANLPLTGDKKADLGALREIDRQTGLSRALEIAKTMRGRPSKRIRFRVVVQATDADWRPYRRNEMQQALIQGVADAYPKWKYVDEEADFEIWLQQCDRKAVIGIRLSDATMRHRTYKVTHMPGSLRPTVARAMAFLSRPNDDDIVVDPVCGQGTVLIERALLGRYRLVLGGDVAQEAVTSATENFGRKHRPRGLCLWDAARLPLGNDSVDKILANLPWGHRIEAEVESHYTQVLRETQRVLKSGGNGVFLTNQSRTFQNLLHESETLFEVERVINISVLGRNADVFVVQKG